MVGPLGNELVELFLRNGDVNALPEESNVASKVVEGVVGVIVKGSQDALMGENAEPILEVMALDLPHTLLPPLLLLHLERNEELVLGGGANGVIVLAATCFSCLVTTRSIFFSKLFRSLVRGGDLLGVLGGDCCFGATAAATSSSSSSCTTT